MGEEYLYKCNPSSYYLMADIFGSVIPLTAEEHKQLINRKRHTQWGKKADFFFLKNRDFSLKCM